MALQEPLLHVDSFASKASTARSSQTVVKDESLNFCAFETLITQREKESVFTFYFKEQQNIKEIEVLELVIKRLMYHTEKMGEKPAEHQVIVRLRNLTVELAQIQRKLNNLPVLELLLAELLEVKGLLPLPTVQNVKNYLWAMENALDTTIKIAEMEDLDSPDEQDPNEQDMTERRHSTEEDDEQGEEKKERKEGKTEKGDLERKSSVTESSAPDTEEGELPVSDGDENEDYQDMMNPRDLQKQYSVKQLKQQLREIGLPVQVGPKKETADDLAKRLADALNSRAINTVHDFFDKWWRWKKTKTLPEAEVEPMRKLCEGVAECMTSRLEAALFKFNDYPMCKWFGGLVQSSLENHHFGVLEEWQLYFDESSSEDTTWMSLAEMVDILEKVRLIDETCLGYADRKFISAVAEIHAKVLPSFVLKLTRMKAIMAAQVLTTNQARNQALAMAVTAAIAVMQLLSHFLANKFGFVH